MRPLIILIVIVALLAAGLYALAGIDTEVPQTRVEKAVPNDRLAR
ncbi:hypothetical protein GGR88_001042 [Sphingomonas jejuensis]|jgi:hypothetical protein|uniref:Uncharacterized protein n=1 Tax=Sphingomonas jejuensis TaxID=904715 RepID=A0ABX0XJQ1_9SPHN|nr:hypothetical protein [Sphingomonas jejuensis]NJC33568.1 hypothetical protein [Sphingomonas jejuensis]